MCCGGCCLQSQRLTRIKNLKAVEKKMTDKAIVHIGENSPEEVAFKLFKEIVSVEIHNSNPPKAMSKKWILDTYAECLLTVRGPISRTRQT